jgi:ribosome-associated protein
MNCCRPRFSTIFAGIGFTYPDMQTAKLQMIAVAALEEIKGRDIEVINTTKLTSLFDRIVIASADSTRQVKALARNVREKVEEAGGEVVGVEGEESGEWVLVDLGNIVVHVMQPTVRSYYNLEELWQATPKVRLGKLAGKAGAEPAK